jgi:hypothetical protein
VEGRFLVRWDQAAGIDIGSPSKSRCCFGGAPDDINASEEAVETYLKSYLGDT